MTNNISKSKIASQKLINELEKSIETLFGTNTRKMIMHNLEGKDGDTVIEKIQEIMAKIVGPENTEQQLHDIKIHYSKGDL